MDDVHNLMSRAVTQNGQSYSCGTSRMDDIHNLVESGFVSNKNLGRIPGDAVVPEGAFQGTQWSQKNPETSWNIQTEG